MVTTAAPVAGKAGGRGRRPLRLDVMVALATLFVVPAWAEPVVLDWSAVVSRNLPAVVNISAETLTKDPADGSLHRHRELGSGFLIDPSGIIVTNRHVIDGAFRIMVTASEGNEHWPATLIGGGRLIDLAVLKINTGHPMAFLKFAADNAVRAGDPVLVIGNPLGLGTSVSGGLVSALNRNLMNTPLDNYIQTDAAINHGNSGGPVLDRDGEVVGVASILVTNRADEGSNGLGFAIAGWDAAAYVHHLIDPKAQAIGWIGVHLQEVTPDLTEAFALRQKSGSLITQLDPDGPAAAAGLRTGDIIIGEQDEAPSDPRGLLRRMALAPAGKAVKLRICRDGEEMPVSVTVAEWPAMEMPAQSMRGTANAAHAEPADFGLVLAPVSEAARRMYGIAARDGVLVTAVDPASEASSNGIVPGDVIEKVQGRPVQSADEATRSISEAESSRRYVGLLVNGKSGRRWIALYSG